MTPEQEEISREMTFVNIVLSLNSANMLKFAEWCDEQGEIDMALAVRVIAENRYREEVKRGDHS